MAKEIRSRGTHSCECSTCRQHPHGPVAREHRALNRLVATADERTRRLLVGFLARHHGPGGIALLARVTGLDRATIARGQRELRRNRPAPAGRSRRPGAGRPGAEKKAPGC
jgi:hypothetical protein